MSRAMTVRAAHRFRTNRAVNCGRKIRASARSFNISPDAQPSNGEGWAGMRTKSAGEQRGPHQSGNARGPVNDQVTRVSCELGRLLVKRIPCKANDAEEPRQSFPGALLGPVEGRPLWVGVNQDGALGLLGPLSGEMQRERGLADAALLIEERNDHARATDPAGRCALMSVEESWLGRGRPRGSRSRSMRPGRAVGPLSDALVATAKATGSKQSQYLSPLAVAPQGSDLAGSVRRNPKDSRLEKLRGLQDADQTGVLVDFGPR